MEPAAAVAAADTEPNDDEFIINLKLLKLIGYYDLIVPDRDRGGKPSWSVFGYSGHRVCFVALFVMVQIGMVFANAGFVLPVEYTLPSVDFFLCQFANLMNLMTAYKTCMLFYRVRDVAALLDVTRFDFLSSEACRRNRGTVLSDCRDRVFKFTNRYTVFCCVVIFQWMVFAAAIAAFSGVADSRRAAGERVPNVMNMPFTVSARAYNRYFMFFYVFESTVGNFILYCMLMIDMYLLSYGWIITAQYEVLARAFEDFGHRRSRGIDSDDGNANAYEELKSILSDQLKLFLKFKTFLVVARPIIMTIVAVSSTGMIILTFVFVMIYSTPALFSIDYLCKVGNIDLYLCIQLYLFSNLMNNLNEKRDSVNFAIYSSNWTAMDFKVKKMLLLAMRMNDANPLYMKASPRKLIDLQLFASVMTTCYNITSVLVNTLTSKN